ncbi:putative membrane protein [Enterobacter hormaechei]|nr:putative membrane protein [Enterobacter hormaechei]
MLTPEEISALPPLLMLSGFAGGFLNWYIPVEYSFSRFF